MYLNEFPKNTRIDITVKISGQRIKLSTTIMDNVKKPSKKYGRGIICKPVIVNKHMINFGNYSATISIFNKKDGRAYKFRTTCIATNRLKRMLVICSKDNAKPSDNRSAYRIPCCYDIILKPDDSTRTINGRTHDLSYTGAAFIINKKEAEAVKVGDKITASIYDLEEHVYKVTGKIVRTCEGFDKESILLGIKFSNDALKGLISRLQIKETRIVKTRI